MLTRIPVSTQRLTATHLCVTWVSVKREGLFFLVERHNLVFEDFKLGLRRVKRCLDIENFITLLSRQRSPCTALWSDAVQLRREEIVIDLWLEYLYGTPQRTIGRSITGDDSPNSSYGKSAAFIIDESRETLTWRHASCTSVKCSFKMVFFNNFLHAINAMRSHSASPSTSTYYLSKVAVATQSLAWGDGTSPLWGANADSASWNRKWSFEILVETTAGRPSDGTSSRSVSGSLPSTVKYFKSCSGALGERIRKPNLKRGRRPINLPGTPKREKDLCQAVRRVVA